MPFRFRKIFRLGKGFRLNVSKSGVSTSMGGKGFTLNMNQRGVRPTISAPGTGIAFTPSMGNRTKKSASGGANLLINCLVFAISLIFICVIGFFCWGLLFLDTDTVSVTATPTSRNISTIIVQTFDAANAQTQLASSPTPFFTSTNLPTLTQPVIPTPITISTSASGPVATNTFVFILPTQPAPAGGSCSCSGDLYNCTTDFSTQAQAQACFNFCVSQGVGDIHQLDGNDGDGRACESLP